MITDAKEFLFSSRSSFRTWLEENAETSEGIWLIFGKSKDAVTLTASDALEEALCFGWIDGQMKSIDTTKYRKYFSRRRSQSPWSDKNKKIVEVLREKHLMSKLGEQAVEVAKQNGMWETSPTGLISDEQMNSFTDKLNGVALENFLKMPQSTKVTFVKRYLSFKKEETRQKDFEKIVEILKENRKLTINKKR